MSSSSRTPFIYRGRTIVILGAYVRIHDGRYLAGFAVLDDDVVVKAASLPAPADADEARQLEELHGFTAGLVDEFQPEHLALKVSEHRNQGLRPIANRGEGAILAAAGKTGVPMRFWYGAGLRTPAGFGRSGTTQECVDALCANLAGEDLPTSEVEQAAAAAAASRFQLAS